jgi:hypothetical protein
MHLRVRHGELSRLKTPLTKVVSGIARLDLGFWDNYDLIYVRYTPPHVITFMVSKLAARMTDCLDSEAVNLAFVKGQPLTGISLAWVSLVAFPALPATDH